MGYMAGVTDDPYTSVGGDKPIADIIEYLMPVK